MTPTPYPDINDLLHQLVAQITEALAENTAGIYLYGSLVWGDFDVEISDIDLMVATRSPLTEAEFESVERLHRAMIEQYPMWEERIEIAYLSLEALATFKEQRSTIAVISPGEPFHFKEAGEDRLINWYMVRRKGAVLFGAPPETIIPPISEAEFMAAVRTQAKGWGVYIHQMRRRAAQAYGILTLCRALYASTFGEQISKRQAAEWAIGALPDWAELIRNALLWRESHRHVPDDDESTFPETLRFVHFIMGEMRD